MKARIVQDTFISGKPVQVGEVLDLDRDTFLLLKMEGRAEEVIEASPQPAQIEITIEDEPSQSFKKKRNK